MRKHVLVTGGGGYIGSHMARLLLERKHSVIIFDNNKNAKARAPKNAVWVNGDLRNYAGLQKVFKAHAIEAVMHFGGLIVIPESVHDPLKYYDHNVSGTINLLKAMEGSKVHKIIFSSSAAVYGSPKKIPVRENAPVGPVSPYGRTKLMMEQALQDAAAANPKFAYVIFRYFNAAGAHENGLTGECHDPETHLVPNVLRTVKGKNKKLAVYGNDYPTRDGTCIRDYIHVQDVCDAHFLDLKAFNKGIKNEIINLGCGRGFSIFEIIRMAEEVTGRKVKFEIKGRRKGDPAVLIASSQKARTLLGWKPQRDLRRTIQTAWAWERKL